MINNKILSIMLVVSVVCLAMAATTFADIDSPVTITTDTFVVGQDIVDGGSLTVPFGFTYEDTAGEVFMAAHDKYSDMTAAMYVYGTATFTDELKLGQYEYSVTDDENEDPITPYVGDNFTLVIGDGVNVATMHIGYLQASSSGGVTTININTNGTLTADDGHIYGPGTSVNLLGGTFRVKNKASGEVDIPETDGIFGHRGLNIAEGGVIVDITTEPGFTLYIDSCTVAKNTAPLYTEFIANGIGDTNYDCIVNLGDFTDMASTWLNGTGDATNSDDLGVMALNWLTDMSIVRDIGCEAAKADGYTAINGLDIGDTNYDCKVNLGDFADMTSVWLNGTVDETDLGDLDVLALNWLTDMSIVPAE